MAAKPRRGVSMAIVALVVVASSLAASPVSAQDVQARVARVLKTTPLIDGHNDWPEVLREREGDGRWTVDLRNRLGTGADLYNTDITRLRQGMVGGQFWSVWVSPNLPGPEQVKETIEQIALVQSFAERYPDTFAMARTAADVRRIHKSGQDCVADRCGRRRTDRWQLRRVARLSRPGRELPHADAYQEPRVGGFRDGQSQARWA